MLLPDGTLDRSSLGRLVFNDRAARADLEAIVHPEVYRRIGEWLATLPPRTRIAIADIPLLFETGHTQTSIASSRLRLARTTRRRSPATD
jgi:dephospho-CoA kinase